MSESNYIYSYFADSEFKKFNNNKIPNRISIKEISYDRKELRIIFNEKEKKASVNIQLSFEDIEYMSIGYDIPDESLDLFDTPNWPFYVGEDTAMIRRYKNESNFPEDNICLKHYIIIGIIDETIEILSQSKPVFKNL